MQFQKISILPQQKGLEFPGGWGGGSVRPKSVKKCMKLNWNFQRGGGSVREVWIFSGITQFTSKHEGVQVERKLLLHKIVLYHYRYVHQCGGKGPGNAHDSFIFQDSLIYDKLNDEIKDLEDGFLIGDRDMTVSLF